MECHSAEQKKEKYIKEHLEVNLKILDQVVKLIDVVQWLIEQVILCFIHSLEDL